MVRVASVERERRSDGVLAGQQGSLPPQRRHRRVLGRRRRPPQETRRLRDNCQGSERQSQKTDGGRRSVGKERRRASGSGLEATTGRRATTRSSRGRMRKKEIEIGTQSTMAQFVEELLRADVL